MKTNILPILLLGIISLILLSSCGGNGVPSPDNLLLNPNAEEGLDYWTSSGDAFIDDNYGTTSSFSLRNGGSFLQDVPIDNENGQFALLIGCVASEYVHPDGAITDLPYIYGYMMRDQSSIDAYLRGQRLNGEGISVNEWSTAWGVFEVPSTTIKVRFFLNQASMSGVPYSGSAAYFDKLGLFQFDSETSALKYVDKYQASCGSASSIEIYHKNTITILSNGNTVDSERVGTKRISIKIEAGENRKVDNPPFVLYWSDFVTGDGFETSALVTGTTDTYFFDLPTSDELDLCEWMKFRWVVGYQNTLTDKSGVLIDEDYYVMPTKKYSGNTLQQAMCQSPSE